MIESIAGFFQSGGIFMWAILAIFAVAFGIIVERTYVLYFSHDGGAGIRDQSFMERFLNTVARGGGLEGLRDEIEGNGPLVRIAFRILPHRREERVQLRNVAEEAVIFETPRVTAHLSYLPMLANTAVLLGLLGTIFGLKESFGGVGAASAAEQSEMLSAGIAMALNTTAFGLMVAVPTLLAYTVLKGRAEMLLDKIEDFALQLVNALISASLMDSGNATEPVGSGGRARGE